MQTPISRGSGYDSRRDRHEEEAMQFDTGNTGFMILATSLVMLMTPGLAFFYGGLVGRKNVLAIMMQSFVSMGLTTVIWFICGYSMCFSGDLGGIIGNFDMSFLIGVDLHSAFGQSSTGPIPLFVFIAYQMMFAIITPALITGAFTNRVRFGAYVLFLVAWLLFVYFPLVHMVWGGGLLAQWGVKDFAGGIVVHASAGMAALASVLFVGKRRVADPGMHNIPLVALGTGLLWFGWYGFNAGSELRVDAVTSQAFLNTDVAASFAGISWMVVAWALRKKATFVGLLTGAVAGLATITPCAGFVTVSSSALIGTIAGVLCFFAVALKTRLGWDDALDVWAVHGVGGVSGTIFLGLFANAAVGGASGLFNGGGPELLMKQTIAVLGVAVYSFLFTWAMLWIINKVTRVRVSEAEEANLDKSLHGEVAYDM
jgi:ammonium transporter, Amt family